MRLQQTGLAIGFTRHLAQLFGARIRRAGVFRVLGGNASLERRHVCAGPGQVLFRECRGGFCLAQHGCGIFFRKLVDPPSDDCDLLLSHRRLVQGHSRFLLAPEIKNQRACGAVPGKHNRPVDYATPKDRFG